MIPPHVHPAGWAIAASLAALMGILAVGDGRGPRVPGWILSLLAALMALNLATAVQALQAARTSALLLAYFLVYLFASRSAAARAAGSDAGKRSDSSVDWALLVIVLAGVGLSIHGLYQSLYLFGRMAADTGLDLSEPVRARLASGRAVSTLGLPAALGGFLAMSLPVTVGSWLVAARRRARRRWWLAAAFMIQLGGLVSTRSAGAVLSLAAAAALVMWARSTRSGDRSVRKLRRAGVVIVTVGLLLAVAFLAVRLNAPGSEDEGSGPLNLRAGNWKVAVEMMADHPMLGVGAGCYGVAFPAYREWGMNESRFAHNSYLQMFAEAGSFLGLAFLILMGLLASRFMSGHSGHSGPWSDWRAIAGLSFLVHNLVDFTFFLPTVGFVFFWLAGISGPASGTGRRRSGLAAWMVAPLSLLLAVFALGVYRSDSALLQARSLVETGRQVAAADAARQSVRANPFDPDARSFLSRLLLDEARSRGDAGLMDESYRHARAATSMDPWTPHHWHHLAQVLLARGDPVGAYIAVARAARLYPIRIEYREERDSLGQGLEQRRSRP